MKWLLKVAQPYVKSRENSGIGVINAAGEMDRALVRAHVFTHPEALIELEAITHPAIREAAKYS